MCIPYQKWNENRFRYIYISSHCRWVAGLYNIQQQDLSHPHSYRNNATSVFIQRKQLDKYIQQCAQDAPRGAVHTNQKNRPTTFFFLFSFWCASITPRGYFQHKKEKFPDVAAPISGRGNILCGIGLYYHLWIKKRSFSFACRNRWCKSSGSFWMHHTWLARLFSVLTSVQSRRIIYKEIKEKHPICYAKNMLKDSFVYSFYFYFLKQTQISRKEFLLFTFCLYIIM